MQNLLLYVASVLIWGSTWIVINYQLGVVPPEVSIAWRYALAAVVLFAWCLARGIRLRYGWRDHGVFVLFGALLFGFNYVGAYLAQDHIPSALNAVCFTSVVWLNIINARLFLRTPLDGRVIAGAMLGMVGIVVLFWPSLAGLDWSSGALLGLAFSLGGAFCASLGNVVSQRAQARGLTVTPSNAWGMAYGALIVAAAAALQGKPFAFDWRLPYVASLLYLSLIGSVLAFGCYLTLLGRIGAHRAGFVVVLFPVVAIALSIAFEDLAIDGHMVGGALLVLAGNVVILGGALGKRRRATAKG